MKKTAMIIGATGLVGEKCLQYLIQSNAYDSVIALTRRKLSVNHPKLNNIVLDFDALEENVSRFAVDDVYCCLGTTIKTAGSKAAFRQVDYVYCYQLAQIAKKQGAQHFLLVSAVGANSKSTVFYSRVKGELENSLKALNYLQLSVFQPSLLLGERQEMRVGELLGRKSAPLINVLIPRYFDRYKPIESERVAAAMVVCATKTVSEELRPDVYRVYTHRGICQLAASL